MELPNPKKREILYEKVENTTSHGNQKTKQKTKKKFIHRIV